MELTRNNIINKNKLLAWKRGRTQNETLYGVKYVEGETVEAPWVSHKSELSYRNFPHGEVGLYAWTYKAETLPMPVVTGDYIVLLIDKKDGCYISGHEVAFRKAKVLIVDKTPDRAVELIKSIYPRARLDTFLHEEYFQMQDDRYIYNDKARALFFV